MKTWHFFDRASGLFDGRAYAGPAAHLVANTLAGYCAAEDVTDWQAQRATVAVDDFGAEQVTLADYQPPAPADDDMQTWAWSAEAHRWFATPTLAALKAAKRGEINKARLTANRSSFAFAGKQIACDELSRGDIDGITSAVALTGELPPDFPGAWKAVDNTYVPISDVATWGSLVAAMVARGTANFARSQSLKALLEAAATADAVAAISWAPDQPG